MQVRASSYNSNKSPTRCNNFPDYCPDAHIQLNMFRAFSRPSSGAHDCSSSPWRYLRIVVIVVLCSWSGRSARPRTLHDCHHDTKVKPEAATAVIELLMMGGRTPEACWAVNKRQYKELENCCVWLVIYLNHVYFFSLHVSGEYVPIIIRNSCIYMTLDTCYSVWMTVWYAGWNDIPPCIPLILG